jgi:biopolymer transport protein ExbD
MAARRYRSTLEIKSEINITPLMDVMCLLMIVFMITSPMLEYDVDVSPPKSTTSVSQIDEENKIMVTLFANGRIHCNRTEVAMDDLGVEIKKIHGKMKNPDKTRVLIRADGKKQLNEVFEVWRIVKKAGITSIGLATQPEKPQPN